MRKIVMVDFVTGKTSEGEQAQLSFKVDDPSKYQSKALGRGPVTPDWYVNHPGIIGLIPHYQYRLACDLLLQTDFHGSVCDWSFFHHSAHRVKPSSYGLYFNETHLVYC